MGVLDVNNLKKEFGSDLLFSDVTFTLNPFDKLAIIGQNGAGKTTLVKMILNQESIDAGSINIASNKTVGYLSQVMIHSFENTLYEEMLCAFDEVIAIGKKMNEVMEKLTSDPDNKVLLKQYGSLENQYANKQGYDYEYLIHMMISKFGFSKEDYNRKISSFSGGERNKIAFTKLLLNHPDILILDEPTNHLDVSTIEWLEEYLKSYQGAIILISHDRYFIDSVCDCILEIENQTASYYKGNYSYYLNEKVLRYEQQLKAYNLQEKEIERLENLIKKFMPKPTKVSFAKDRQKKLARIMENRVAAPTNKQKTIHLNIESKDTRRVRQLTVENLTFGYNNESLTDPVSFYVFGGDKIGIIGDNGTGKTTLLKVLGDMYQKIDGKYTKHRELKIGYIDQNQIQINSEESAFDYLHNIYPMMTNYEIRHHLGAFLFTEDDVFKKVNQLSGGEKVRLSFAKLVLKKYDILLLDEPTNHLDIETRKVLEATLRDYPGTIIFVSHDRYFIDEIATQILAFKDKKVTWYQEDYASYLEEIKNKVIDAPKKQTEEKEEKVKIKSNRPQRLLSVEKYEEKINKIQLELEHLYSLMEEEEYYMDQRKMDELDDKIITLKIELSHLEEEYLLKLEQM